MVISLANLWLKYWNPQATATLLSEKWNAGGVLSFGDFSPFLEPSYTFFNRICYVTVFFLGLAETIQYPEFSWRFCGSD